MTDTDLLLLCSAASEYPNGVLRFFPTAVYGSDGKRLGPQFGPTEREELARLREAFDHASG